MDIKYIPVPIPKTLGIHADQKGDNIPVIPSEPKVKPKK